MFCKFWFGVNNKSINNGRLYALLTRVIVLYLLTKVYLSYVVWLVLITYPPPHIKNKDRRHVRSVLSIAYVYLNVFCWQMFMFCRITVFTFYQFHFQACSIVLQRNCGKTYLDKLSSIDQVMIKINFFHIDF